MLTHLIAQELTDWAPGRPSVIFLPLTTCNCGRHLEPESVISKLSWWEATEGKTYPWVQNMRADTPSDPPSWGYSFLFGGAPVTVRQETRRKALECFPFLSIIPEDGWRLEGLEREDTLRCVKNVVSKHVPSWRVPKLPFECSLNPYWLIMGGYASQYILMFFFDYPISTAVMLGHSVQYVQCGSMCHPNMVFLSMLSLPFICPSSHLLATWFNCNLFSKVLVLLHAVIPRHVNVGIERNVTLLVGTGAKFRVCLKEGVSLNPMWLCPSFCWLKLVAMLGYPPHSRPTHLCFVAPEDAPVPLAGRRASSLEQMSSIEPRVSHSNYNKFG